MGLLFSSHCWAGQSPISITLESGKTGQRINDWGYDIKEGGAAEALTPEYARELFVDDRMTCLRIPIYGDEPHPAHPASGKIVESYYAPIISAVGNVRAVLPNVVIFASKKSERRRTFPKWVLHDGAVAPGPYAELLADYLRFMQVHGITIDVLGIDNEMELNHGKISPQCQEAIMDRLERLSAQLDFSLPRHFIGPDSYRPRPEWVREMLQLPGDDRLDMVGTHYYPEHRPMADLERLVSAGKGRPTWLTELHWPGKMAHGDTLVEGQRMLATVFDATDAGVSGFVWWGYQRAGLEGAIEQAVTRSLVGTSPMAIFADKGTEGLTVRAFRSDGGIVLWIINDLPVKDPAPLDFRLDRGRFSGGVEASQWKESGQSAISSATAYGGTVTVPISAQKSLTEVLIPYKEREF